jgi:hypothetical protein
MNQPVLLKAILQCIVVSLVLLTEGCSPVGQMIVREKPNQIPSLIEAPADGIYGLFVAGDSDPFLRFDLKKSEKIGFELSQAAVIGDMRLEQIFAIAGEHRIPLDLSKAYEWRKE